MRVKDLLFRKTSFAQNVVEFLIFDRDVGCDSIIYPGITHEDSFALS